MKSCNFAIEYVSFVHACMQLINQSHYVNIKNGSVGEFYYNIKALILLQHTTSQYIYPEFFFMKQNTGCVSL